MKRSTRLCSRQLATALLIVVPTLVTAAAPAPAVAQDPTRVDAVWESEPVVKGEAVSGLGADDTVVPSVFGTEDVDIATISWMRFFPIRSTDGYGFGGSGTIARHALGPDTRLWAEIGSGEVPNGALITQIVFYVRDAHAADIASSWCVFNLGSNLGTGYTAGCNAVGSTSGTPGETFVFADMAETVQRRFDNGSEFRIASYGLLFWPQAATEDLDIRMARVLWRRQVSPAPASATFGDVPTGHPFFPYVEALVDSGVTAGCGDGSDYCPGAPVTRGQMAVFIAKALGMHWPAF